MRAEQEMVAIAVPRRHGTRPAGWRASWELSQDHERIFASARVSKDIIKSRAHSRSAGSMRHGLDRGFAKRRDRNG